MTIERNFRRISRREIKLKRQRLVLYIIKMRLNRASKLAIAFNGKLNALRDLEISLLAHRLHMAYKLASETFSHKLGRKSRINANHNRTLGGNHKPRLRRARD